MSLIGRKLNAWFRSGINNLIGFCRLAPEQRIHIFLFLLPCFFILHGANENFAIIPVMVLLTLLGKYILIALAIICIGFFLFRSPGKSFVFSFYLLCWYFFFGAIYDLLLKTFAGSSLFSYKFLLPGILALTLVVFWLINRYNGKLVKLRRFINTVLLFFVAMEAGLAAYYALSGKSEDNDLSGVFEGQGIFNTDSCTRGSYPDIFFIVFDAYTSSPVLKKEFNFDNSEMDSFFLKNGFFQSHASQSNYNFTAYSLASTFDLSYLRKGVEKDIINPKEVLKGVETLRHNRLVNFLKEKGYIFRNFGRFEMDHMPSKEASFFDYFYHDLIDNQTMYARIRKDIGWVFFGRNIITGKFNIPHDYTEFKQAHLARNESSYRKVLKELELTNDSPRFVYAHIMLPHEPFYLNADGSMADDSAIIFNTIDDKAGYIGQVQFANKWIKKILETVVADKAKNKVIIIEGDHGHRFWDGADLHLEFPNLNAYYFPDADYGMLYDGISPVNSFRVVLNKYFCQQLPILPDSSLYLRKPNQ